MATDWTCGNAGVDTYDTIEDAYAALVGLGALGDDYNVEVTQSHTFTGWTGSEIQLNNHQVKFYSNNTKAEDFPICEYVGGGSLPGTGHIYICHDSFKAGGTLIFEKLHFKSTSGGDSGRYFIDIIHTNWNTTPLAFIFRKLWITIRPSSSYYKGAVHFQSTPSEDGSSNSRFFDIKIDAEDDSYGYSRYTCFLHGTSDRKDAVAENISIRGVRGTTPSFGLGAQSNWDVVKNAVVIKSYGDDCFSGASTHFYNCADNDGSLGSLTTTDCVSNITPADEFKSIDGTSDDFLKPKRGAPNCEDGGIAPDTATEDISGYSLPYKGNYPIGCHVAEATQGKTQGKIVSIF